MRLIPLLIAAAVAVPPVAVAAPFGAAAAEEAAPRQKERRICRREPTTGTRLAAPRVCMTQSEWDAVAERAREDMSRSQQRQTVISNGLNGRSTCPPGIPC